MSPWALRRPGPDLALRGFSTKATLRLATAADVILLADHVIVTEGEGLLPAALCRRAAWGTSSASWRCRTAWAGSSAADQASGALALTNLVLRDGKSGRGTTKLDPSAKRPRRGHRQPGTYRMLWLLLGTALRVRLGRPRMMMRPTGTAAPARRRAPPPAHHWCWSPSSDLLGEILACLPAFDGRPGRPDGGPVLRATRRVLVPSQPDALEQVILVELRSLADDLDTAVARADLAAPWAGPPCRHGWPISA